MLKVTIENERCTVESSGSVMQIVIDAARAVGAIYEGMKDANPIDAEFFKMGIISALTPDSPAWSLMQESEGVQRTVMAIPSKKKWRCPHRSKLGHRTI